MLAGQGMKLRGGLGEHRLVHGQVLLGLVRCCRRQHLLVRSCWWLHRLVGGSGWQHLLVPGLLLGSAC